MSILNAFTSAATSAGKIGKGELFNQHTLIKAEQSTKGICGGIALTFLGLYARSGFRSLNAAKKHSWSALLEFALKLQSQVREVRGGGMTEAQQLMVMFSAAAPVVGLRGSGVVQTLRWPCQGQIARIVSARAGYYIIALPNHYVAAAYDGRSSGVFFDPNAGAAEFGTVDSLSAMITYYFSNPEVTQKYKCSGSDIHILPFEKA
jgi:hypothetical protein